MALMLRRVCSSIICGGYRRAIKIESPNRRGYVGATQSKTPNADKLLRQVVSDLFKPKPKPKPEPSDDDVVEAIPDWFPFEVVYHSQYLRLQRKYGDEIIEVFVPLYHSTDDDDSPSIQLKGYIGKSKHHYIKFRMTAKPGSIVIDSFFMRDYHKKHMEQFKQFLAVRGFNPCTMNSLFDYCRTRATSPKSLSQGNHLVEGIGDGFPFEIKDDDPYKLILRRKYQDEMIELRVVVHTTRSNDIECLYMVFDISHGDKKSVTFQLKALPDNPHEIAIGSMVIREGCPGFQEAFTIFFEKRGIKLGTTDFLFHFIQKLNHKLNEKECFKGINVEKARQLDDHDELFWN